MPQHHMWKIKRLRRGTITRKLTKRDFIASGRLLLSKDTISNGHWVARLSAVPNAALFTSPESAEAAIDHVATASTFPGSFESFCPNPIAVIEWHTTPYLCEEDGKKIRILLDHEGHMAGIDQKLLDTVGCILPTTLYGVGNCGPFSDSKTAEESTWIVMGYRLNLASMIVRTPQ